MRLAGRLANMNSEKYSNTTRISGGRHKWTGMIKFDDAALAQPYRWKKGRFVFVNSMSDLLHESVPDDFIQRVFHVMMTTPQHTYQILTKRAERLAEIAPNLRWSHNVWIGVSVESNEYLWRVRLLRQIQSSVRFLSLEPLLGPLEELTLEGIQWVIVGGESGPESRPINPFWVRSIRDQCLKQSVPFHFKQWGGKNKKLTGRLLDGVLWDQRPSRNPV
jgi:protein gp37